MTAWSMRQVIVAWHDALPSIRAAGDGVRMLDRTVLVGAMTEMCSPSPSTTDMAEATGLYRSGIGKALERWRSMHWRDRHAFLCLVDGSSAQAKARADAWGRHLAEARKRLEARASAPGNAPPSPAKPPEASEARSGAPEAPGAPTGRLRARKKSPKGVVLPPD